ncbi:MAG: glycosyltransferase [Candidatus Nanopelagicales bacterium]
MSQPGSDRLRVVFACTPQTGHLMPLLPLATQFAAAGDEVIFASGPAVADAVIDRGLQLRRVCPDLDDWFAVLRSRTHGLPGDGLAPERVEGYFLPRLFAEIGLPSMVEELTALVREVRPDLLIFEPYALAAPLVAASCGVSSVQHTIGLRMDQSIVDLVNDAVTPAWRLAGLNSPVAAGLFDGSTLGICPPSLDWPDASTAGVQPLSPTVLPDADASLPFELPSEHPLVYLTLGTFSNTDISLFGLVLRALADEPVTVLATLGNDGDTSGLGEVPDNAVVVGYVPQAQVLPHCAAVVHHAGAGTTFGLLAHGLPSVALPQSADNFSMGRRLSDIGVAKVLMPGQVDESSVRESVRAVLTDPEYRRRVELVADEIAAMPGPQEIVDSLRRNARSR